MTVRLLLLQIIWHQMALRHLHTIIVMAKKLTKKTQFGTHQHPAMMLIAMPFPTQIKCGSPDPLYHPSSQLR